MTDVVFYFQVHQPWRLARRTVFDIGRSERWFDDIENARIMRRVARRCYIPMGKRLARLVKETDGAFRCALSISGTALDQMARFAPRALETFSELAATDAVEFLAETSHHALAFLADETEFRAQIETHAARVEALFGRRPTTFRNTELVVDSRVAQMAERLGFNVLLAEGADHLLGWSSPHDVHGFEGCERLRVLLRSYRLSDDIAFRFAERSWAGWPLTPQKFTGWLEELPTDAAVVGLFMDFETLGEHQKAESGILDFLEALPHHVLASGRFRFRTPSEAAAAHPVRDSIAPRSPVSWADAERDTSAWLGNDMQRAAHDAIWSLADAVRQRGSARLVERWRRLTTSDHIYYMATKWAADGDVHTYFSPYRTPHDAFINFMNVVDDLAGRLGRRPGARPLGSRRP